MQVRPLRVAAVNAAPIVGDVTASMAAAAEWCGRAAAQGVELLVFSEAWNTGYDTEVFASDLPDAEGLSWLAPL